MASPQKKAKTTLEDHPAKAKPGSERMMDFQDPINNDINDGDIQQPTKTDQIKTGLDDNGHCPSLRRSIEKWGIMDPYSMPPTKASGLPRYFAERTALQFRHDEFFPLPPR